MLSKRRFIALSEFRTSLGLFLRFSEEAARREGLTSRKYLLLLHLCGTVGRDWATISELADRLNASHQSTVALVQRCLRLGLVTKRRSKTDARCMEIHPTPRGVRLAARVAASHSDEIGRLRAALGTPDLATRGAATSGKGESHAQT